jgi:vancomycin resistance protein YoaR
VTPATLAPAARQARVALSAPVRLVHGRTRWRLPRWRIAQLLSLPEGGATRLAIAGPAAEHWFAQLSDAIDTEPVDARFAVDGEGVSIIPDRPGITVDVPQTAKALLAAAVSPTKRVAEVAVREVPADRTTAEARAMGITERLSSYSTAYAGTADRITNLQLAVTALDGTLIPPGGEFSFNEVVGERTVERGFRPAPVIIAGEYEEAVGGGVSQVATTVFNAAWEAGLKITERNPHALYIARYQLGRDATVNYPDLDLKFVNDTEHWVLIKGSYDDQGINVSIYGTSDRRVESTPGTRRITGPPPLRREPDPTLERGKTLVVEPGTPASATTVVRRIYAGDELLREETWPTYYRGEYRVIKVGTKPPQPKENKRAKDRAEEKSRPGAREAPPPADTGTTDTGARTTSEPAPQPSPRTP